MAVRGLVTHVNVTGASVWRRRFTPYDTRTANKA